jgi:hypothetical protein
MLNAVPVARKKAAGRNPGAQWPLATTAPDSASLPSKRTSFGAHPGYSIRDVLTLTVEGK